MVKPLRGKAFKACHEIFMLAFSSENYENEPQNVSRIVIGCGFFSASKNVVLVFFS